MIYILLKTRTDAGDFIIVSGGQTVNAITDSTEILEPGMSSWGKGPSLPIPTVCHCMVEDKLTSSVLLLGGYSNGILSGSIYQLKAPLTITR